MIEDEKLLWARLKRIGERMSWIANEEARSAWVDGLAARGMFQPERDRLIEEVEKILDKLQFPNS